MFKNRVEGLDICFKNISQRIYIGNCNVDKHFDPKTCLYTMYPETFLKIFKISREIRNTLIETSESLIALVSERSVKKQTNNKTIYLKIYCHQIWRKLSSS